jgi:hypothetical protein
VKYCADCEKENEDDATQCSECGGSDLRHPGPRFNDFDFDPLKSEQLGYEWVNLIRCATVVEADSVAMTLRAAGIPVFIPDEYTMQAFAGLNAIGLGFVRVQVPPSKYDEARQVLTEPTTPDDGSNAASN